MKSEDEVADNSTNCGKCHNSCEYGRSHQGLVPNGVGVTGGLPLDAEGRTTCFTCHESHNDGLKQRTGAHLRISNLRRELCLACHRQDIQDTKDTPRVEIVSPLERAVVRENRLALIGRASHLAGALLTVRLNGAEFHLHVKDGDFSTWLTLQDGINRIDVAQDDRILWKGEVFHGEVAVGGYERASSGHLTGNREQCLECHAKKGETISVTTEAAPALCFGCHDRNNQKRYVHGPLAVGDCLVCHDPHGGFGVAHLRTERALLCDNCHSARENSPQTACDSSSKGCMDCHDPHQSDMRYLLKGPQYTMRDAFLRKR